MSESTPIFIKGQESLACPVSERVVKARRVQPRQVWCASRMKSELCNTAREILDLMVLVVWHLAFPFQVRTTRSFVRNYGMLLFSPRL